MSAMQVGARGGMRAGRRGEGGGFFGNGKRDSLASTDGPTGGEALADANRFHLGHHGTSALHLATGNHLDVPGEDEIEIDEIMEKMCAEDRWQQRRVVVTVDSLLFTRVGESQIIDSIPLHEISGLVLEGNSEVVELTTVHGGYNSGRPYVMRTNEFVDAPSRASQFAEQLRPLISNAQWRVAERTSRWRHRQARIKAVYDSTPVQVFVAMLISSNFLANAIEKQIRPEPSSVQARQFDDLEIVFTALFTAELLVNLVAHWWKPFINDGWNLFDTLVVMISIVGVSIESMPGLSILRLLRAFRVLRLFGRLGAQRKIIAAITASLAPVLHALVIVLLVMSIYSILAVDFFGDNHAQFGTFVDSLFTMFQVATFEGWSDLARELFEDENRVSVPIFIFFASYISIVSWTLLPVVVALLLDNFTTVAMMERKKAEEEKKMGKRAIAHVLDPLLTKLVHFNTATDLTARIATLYSILDVDDSGGLSYKELFEGLKKLKLSPGIHLSAEDYDTITLQGTLLNDKGELGLPEFEEMMRVQLRLWVERTVEGAMSLSAAVDSTGETTALFSTLKMVLLELEDVRMRLPLSSAEQPISGRLPRTATFKRNQSDGSSVLDGAGIQGHAPSETFADQLLSGNKKKGMKSYDGVQFTSARRRSLTQAGKTTSLGGHDSPKMFLIKASSQQTNRGGQSPPKSAAEQHKLVQASSLPRGLEMSVAPPTQNVSNLRNSQKHHPSSVQPQGSCAEDAEKQRSRGAGDLGGAGGDVKKRSGRVEEAKSPPGSSAHAMRLILQDLSHETVPELASESRVHSYHSSQELPREDTEAVGYKGVDGVHPDDVGVEVARRPERPSLAAPSHRLLLGLMSPHGDEDAPAQPSDWQQSVSSEHASERNVYEEGLKTGVSPEQARERNLPEESPQTGTSREQYLERNVQEDPYETVESPQESCSRNVHERQLKTRDSPEQSREKKVQEGQPESGASLEKSRERNVQEEQLKTEASPEDSCSRNVHERQLKSAASLEKSRSSNVQEDSCSRNVQEEQLKSAASPEQSRSSNVQEEQLKTEASPDQSRSMNVREEQLMTRSPGQTLGIKVQEGQLETGASPEQSRSRKVQERQLKTRSPRQSRSRNVQEGQLETGACPEKSRERNMQEGQLKSRSLEQSRSKNVQEEGQLETGESPEQSREMNVQEEQLKTWGSPEQSRERNVQKEGQLQTRAEESHERNVQEEQLVPRSPEQPLDRSLQDDMLRTLASPAQAFEGTLREAWSKPSPSTAVDPYEGADHAHAQAHAQAITAALQALAHALISPVQTAAAAALPGARTLAPPPPGGARRRSMGDSSWVMGWYAEPGSDTWSQRRKSWSDVQSGAASGSAGTGTPAHEEVKGLPPRANHSDFASPVPTRATARRPRPSTGSARGGRLPRSVEQSPESASRPKVTLLC